MKHLVALFIFTLSLLSISAQEEIQWMTWEEMIAKREKDEVKKKVFIDFTTGWCGWCKKMDATTFKDPSVVQYMNQKYYAVKFDAETRDTIEFNGHTFINSEPSFIKASANARGKTHWFAYSILDGAMSYPSYVILDENLTRLTIYPGYKTQEDLIGILVFFATEQYKYYHNYLNKLWNQSLQQTPSENTETGTNSEVKNEAQNQGNGQSENSEPTKDIETIEPSEDNLKAEESEKPEEKKKEKGKKSKKNQKKVIEEADSKNE